MKKHPIYILFTLLLLLIVASCMRDNNLKELLSTPTFTVEEAKEAFESQVETFEIRPFTTNPKTRGKEIPAITPIWNKGNNYSENSVAYIEVPLNVGLMKLFGRKEVNTEVPEDEKYLNTDIRLCVQKGKSETYVFSLVYITGDFSYVIKKKNKIKKLSLSDLSGFSGQIRTFDLSGNLLWGYVYKDGEKVGHISLKDKAEGGNRVQTRGYETECEDHLFEYETCYYTGYEDGEGITWTDEDCYYDYGYETVCYDVWVDDEDEEDPCPNCGSTLCGGGCTGTDPEPPTIAPKAKKIFRNSNMTPANWDKLEKMIEKILKNCMGESLYDALETILDGKTFVIQFNDPNNGSSFDGDGISLSMNMESNHLFHEMWHAYQAYQENASSFWGEAVLNIEIEAHYAQYLYLQGLPEYSGSNWEKAYASDERLLAIAGLDDYLDTKGNLSPNSDNDLFDTYMEYNVVTSFRKTPEYNNYLYDSTRPSLSNFSNLRVLTINC